MEWISVKDRKPSEGTGVLCWVAIPAWPCGETDLGFLDGDEWITRQWKGDVTHWMPLPEDPSKP